MKIFIKNILIHIILWKNILLQEEKTLLLIEYFRHGARLPYVPYKLDSNHSPILDDSDLTAIGMRQQYLLGKAIRDKYQNFLDEEYTYTNVEVYSSNRRRTIVSAMCQLQGLFDLGTGMEIDNDDPQYYNPPIPDFNIPFPEDQKKNALPFKPTFIPVQSADEGQNYMFTVSSDCPNGKKQYNQIKDDTIQKYNSTFTHTYENLLQHNYFPQMYTKEKYYSLLSAYKACDAVISNYYSDPLADQDQQLLEECYYLTVWWLFTLHSDENYQKLATSEVSKLLIKNLKLKNEGQNQDLQLLLLSAHDVSLIPFLKIFYPNNARCVLDEYIKRYVKPEQDVLESQCVIDQLGFTSNIIMELYEKEGKKYVRMSLSNQEMKVFNDQSSSISVEEFIKILEKQTLDDFDKQCGVENVIIKNDTKTYLVFLILSLIVLAGLIGFYAYLKKREEEEQSVDQEQLIL